MSKLTAAGRKKMPASEFAGPGRSFPDGDKTHARMAISGATRSMHAGNISAATAKRIKAKARRKLGIVQSANPDLEERGESPDFESNEDESAE